MAVREAGGDRRLFPGWGQLLTRGAQRLKDENNAVHASLVSNLLSLKPPDYLGAARYARDGMGAAIWFDFLKKELDRPPESASSESLDLARAVWSLGSKLVVTTNFDRVLHWASPVQGGPASWDITAPVELASMLRGELPNPTVWHLHGQIHNASRLILTEDGYSLLYTPSQSGDADAPYRAALEMLRSLLASHTFLFVGFSLDDVFFRRQLDEVNRIYEGAGGPHYVLMREADVAHGLREEKSVKVVTFSAFEAPLLELVRELGAIAAAQAASPAAGADSRADDKRAPVVADYDPRHTPFFVPFRQKGDQVIGREAALQAVREQLTSGHRTPVGQTASLQGLGGLGKTQLAVEYAYHFRDTYPNGVIWLNADQDIDAQLTDLAEKARWVSPLSEHKYKLETATRRLRTYSDCLIVFDNLEDPQAIQDYLPEPQADPHILVTSRFDQPGFTPIPLDLLSESLSIQLLQQEAGRKPEGEAEEQAAREIARALGGLPLALELAGAYLQYRQISFQQYRDLLRQGLKTATAIKLFGGSFTKHETDLYSTLQVNEEVFEEEPRLRDILDLLTWSGSAPMGLSLMCQLLNVEDPVELTSALGLGTLLRFLQKTSNANSYAIHRLLSQVHREERPLSARQDWVSDVCVRAGEWFQARRREFTDLPSFEAEIDHLKAWQEHAERYGPKLAARLIWLQHYPPYHRGRYREAKALVESALQSFGRNQISDDGLKASLLDDLGSCHYSFQDYQKALGYAEESLAIRSNLFGEVHADTADSLTAVGISHNGLLNYQRGLGYCERALDVRLKLFGENHPDTARSYASVSVCHVRLKDERRALGYAEKALNIQLSLHGERHPSVAYSLTLLGGILNNLGELKRAKEHAEKALSVYREHLGDQHSETIICAVGVAMIYRNMRRPRQGFQLLDELLHRVSEDAPRYNVLKEMHAEFKKLISGRRRATTGVQRRKKSKKKKA